VQIRLSLPPSASDALGGKLKQRSETGLKTTTGYMSDLTEFVRDLPCRNCGFMWSLAPYRDVELKRICTPPRIA